jgi:hypothetical protein
MFDFKDDIFVVSYINEIKKIISNNNKIEYKNRLKIFDLYFNIIKRLFEIYFPKSKFRKSKILYEYEYSSFYAYLFVKRFFLFSPFIKLRLKDVNFKFEYEMWNECYYNKEIKNNQWKLKDIDNIYNNILIEIDKPNIISLPQIKIKEKSKNIKKNNKFEIMDFS